MNSPTAAIIDADARNRPGDIGPSGAKTVGPRPFVVTDLAQSGLRIRALCRWVRATMADGRAIRIPHVYTGCRIEMRAGFRQPLAARSPNMRAISRRAAKRSR